MGWKGRNYLGHAPHSVKIGVLKHYAIPGATWVETGTFLGDTTRVLSKIAPLVYTIEPSAEFVELAQKSKLGTNVEILPGLSEEVLPELIKKIDSRANFWLDGHFSEGATHRGPLDTPIHQELLTISSNLAKFDELAIFIDDFRSFVNWSSDGSKSDYPEASFLVNWAIQHHMKWTVEHDIFVMARKNSA